MIASFTLTSQAANALWRDPHLAGPGQRGAAHDVRIGADVGI